jgi:hypothetical protein
MDNVPRLPAPFPERTDSSALPAGAKDGLTVGTSAKKVFDGSCRPPAGGTICFMRKEDVTTSTVLFHILQE